MKKTILLSVLSMIAALSTASASTLAVPPGFPAKVACTNNSAFRVILVTEDPKLPAGIALVAVKKGEEVLVKDIAQLWTESNTQARFVSSEGLKEFHIDFKTKVVTVFNLNIDGIKNGTQYVCQY